MPKPSFSQDLLTLIKFKLNIFVLSTTLFGFYLACSEFQESFWQHKLILLHTLVGTALTAWGACVFNQVFEIELDKKMRRTSNRPLPSQRMSVLQAFIIGWLFLAFGIVHLAMKVNTTCAVLASLTAIIYIFIYTPLKLKHSSNTLVGAIPGAIPPLIGFCAISNDFTWQNMTLWFLFSLLFCWQLPHFVALSWMYQQQYIDAGYKMWSNKDNTGKKSALLCLLFSIALSCVSVFIFLSPSLSLLFGILFITMSSYQIYLCVIFWKSRTVLAAKKIFFMTLIFLPLTIVFSLL